MEINSYTKLIEIIEFEIGRSSGDRISGDSYCIYWKDRNKEYPKLDDIVYVGVYPTIDENDDYKETFPKEVISKGWWLCYRDELIQDAIDNALHQNPRISLYEINEAIDYYNKNDCFKKYE